VLASRASLFVLAAVVVTWQQSAERKERQRLEPCVRERPSPAGRGAHQGDVAELLARREQHAARVRHVAASAGCAAGGRPPRRVHPLLGKPRAAHAHTRCERRQARCPAPRGPSRAWQKRCAECAQDGVLSHDGVPAPAARSSRSQPRAREAGGSGRGARAAQGGLVLCGLALCQATAARAGAAEQAPSAAGPACAGVRLLRMAVAYTFCCAGRLSQELDYCAAVRHPSASANMAALSAFCRAHSHTFPPQRRSRLHLQQRKRHPCSAAPCTAPPTSPRRCATRRWMCALRQEHACRLSAASLAPAACARNPTLRHMTDAHAHCVSHPRPPAAHKRTVAPHVHGTYPSVIARPCWPALGAAFSNRLDAEPSAHLIAGLPCSQPASRAAHSELAAAA